MAASASTPLGQEHGLHLHGLIIELLAGADQLLEIGLDLGAPGVLALPALLQDTLPVPLPPVPGRVALPQRLDCHLGLLHMLLGLIMHGLGDRRWPTVP